MADTNNIKDLVEKSARTDLQVLLSAKEKAKRLALEDPSPANMSALERAGKMLEAAMTAAKALTGWKEALAHITEELGRKCGKTKLFDDIKAGRLKKQPDGSFRLRDVERYAASLPMAGTPDGVAEKAADRQRRKEELEIEEKSLKVRREALKLAVEEGRYVLKSDVHLELAARAVTLASGLKTAFEARHLDLVDAVGGNPKKGAVLVELLERMLDEELNNYSREMEFEVTFLPGGESDGADS